MRTVETVAQRACRLLSPIPEEEWITRTLSNNKSRCCALGHYYRLNSEDPNDYLIGNEAYCTDLAKTARAFLYKKNSQQYASISIERINDYKRKDYPQPTAKQRVLALLHDMIKEGL